MTVWLQRAGNLVAAISVLFFLYLAIASPGVFRYIEADFASNGLHLIFAAAIYVIGMGFGALAWLALVRATGEHMASITAIKTMFLSQAAKYMPGNVAHHVGRVILARRHGLNTNNILFSMFMETVWVIAIASMLALIALWSVGSSIFNHISQIPKWWVLAGLGSIAMLAPVIGHKFFEYVAHRWARRKGMEIPVIEMPPLRTLWLVSLLYVANYLILGLILKIIAESIFHCHDANILLMSGIFAVAWIVGFITPGAPAGLGVREIILVAALTPIYDQQLAIGIAATLRMVTVLGDALGFLLGLALPQTKKQLAYTDK